MTVYEVLSVEDEIYCNVVVTAGEMESIGLYASLLNARATIIRLEKKRCGKSCTSVLLKTETKQPYGYTYTSGMITYYIKERGVE